MTGSRLLSPRDAEKLLGIPASTVRTWYARRTTTGLYDRGRDARGHPLFAADELLELRRTGSLRDSDGHRRST